MNGTAVTIRYARALYDLAVEKGVLEAVTGDISVIAGILNEAKQIRDYCLRKHTDRIMEMNFINTVFVPYISDLTASALKTAVRNGRLDVLAYLPEAFNGIKDRESGIVEVVLESARPVDKAVKEIVETKMGRHLEKKIRFVAKVTPELLGGIRILWDNRIIDMSAAGRLKIVRSMIKTV